MWAWGCGDMISQQDTPSNAKRLLELQHPAELAIPSPVKSAAIYPGSFDPITLGHLDVIERACMLFDRVVVGVAESAAKHPLFELDERCEMIRESLPEGAAAEVVPFTGLLVDFARKREIPVLIRGLRAVSDFEFEFQMALMNRRLAPQLETVFLTPREDCTFISSRIVKEVAKLGGDVRAFVPAAAAARLQARFASQ